MSTINFYESKDPYYEFSNFYPASFIDPSTGLTWPTSEHYYQASKFVDVVPPTDPKYSDYQAYVELIRQTNTPYKAFLLARQKKKDGYVAKYKISPTNTTLIIDAIDTSLQQGLQRRADWEQIKEDVMERALHLKFNQRPKLSQLLLSTGTAELVEKSPRDWYWGIGSDGSGKNRLGHLLMKLRLTISSH